MSLMKGLEYSSNTPDTSNNHKRRRAALNSTFRMRNGGSSNTSFINTLGLTGTTASGSDTEEEDNEDLAQEYLNKMTDDTDRPMQTIFGRGIDVWKDPDGTVHADLTDRMKKKQRDEAIWGKKRKRGIEKKEEKSLEQRLDSLQNSHSSLNPLQTPSSGAQGWTDGNITYPTLPPSPYDSFIPPTPTASEWELFPVEASYSQSILHPDTLPPPTEYKPLQNGNNRPIKILPARATGASNLSGHSPHAATQGFARTKGPPAPSSLAPPAALQGARRLPSDFPAPTAPPSVAAPATTGLSGNMVGAARRVLSDSFGGVGSASDVDRFDERPYRLGQTGDDAGGSRKEHSKHGEGNLYPFKGRPWLRRE